MDTEAFAPSLTHAIGSGVGGRVRIRTSTLEPYEYVTCEHPDEFLDAVQRCMTANSWIECDSGAIVQVRHVVKIEEVEE